MQKNKLVKIIHEIKFTCEVILHIIGINGSPGEEYIAPLQIVNGRNSSSNAYIYITMKYI